LDDLSVEDSIIAVVDVTEIGCELEAIEPVQDTAQWRRFLNTAEPSDSVKARGKLTG
jgi:hypothetical protein